MTTEKASLDAERSDTVLEKLKRSKEQLDSLDCRKHETYESFLAVQLEANWRIYKVLPRLIAALELVEAKAKETTTYDVWGYVPQEPDVSFAREVLAVVNGKTKGE